MFKRNLKRIKKRIYIEFNINYYYVLNKFEKNKKESLYRI
jgi:hypothetical protein